MSIRGRHFARDFLAAASSWRCTVMSRVPVVVATTNLISIVIGLET
jgi:hypothetical protein